MEYSSENSLRPKSHAWTAWLFLCLLLAGTDGLGRDVQNQPARIWTDVEGRQVTAAVVEIEEDGLVTLVDGSGRNATISWERLSEADRQHAQELLAPPSDSAWLEVLAHWQSKLGIAYPYLPPTLQNAYPFWALGIGGTIIVLFTFMSILYRAFIESPGWGWGSLLLLPVYLVFVMHCWKRTRGSFICQCLGLGLIFGALLVAPPAG